MFIRRIASFLFLIWGFFVLISVMILVLPFILISSAVFRDKQAQDIIFFFLKIWAWILSILCYFPVRVQNRHLVNKNKAYIYVCNHSSYLDAVAVVIAIPGSFKPLGKIEMAKLPIFGLIYKRAVVLIDRKSQESRARSVEELKGGLSKGQSILIFPEGTINSSSNTLAEFYDGAFRLAIETQTPLAPFAIKNTGNLFSKNNPVLARPGLITCIFDKPVDVSGLGLDDLQALKEKVYKQIEGLITQDLN